METPLSRAAAGARLLCALALVYSPGRALPRRGSHRRYVPPPAPLQPQAGLGAPPRFPTPHFTGTDEKVPRRGHLRLGHGTDMGVRLRKTHPQRFPAVGCLRAAHAAAASHHGPGGAQPDADLLYAEGVVSVGVVCVWWGFRLEISMAWKY